MPNPFTYYARSATALWEKLNPQPNQITRYEKEILKERGASGWRIAQAPEDAYVITAVTEVYNKAGAKLPKVIIYDSPKDNAMHLQNDTLCISTAKIAHNDPVGLQATIAHEYGHEAQNGLTFSLIAARLAVVLTATTWLANKAKPHLEKTGAFFSLAMAGVFAATAILAQTVTEIPWKAYRRWQERDADAYSVKLTGSAEGMIKNLERHAEKAAERHHPEPEGAQKMWKDLYCEHDSHEKRIADLKREEAKHGHHLA